MKFVHIADMHFDTPFALLSNKADLGEIRRIDQRRAFKKMIEYIQENHIPYLWIAGDLYDQNYIRQSTIAYINELFSQIPETQIYITPGNHDPYLKNSYYATYNWSKNVKIFSSKIEKIETPEADIYGFGFDDFYCYESAIENIQIENPEKMNIFITHASVDASQQEERNYNAISSKKLKSLGFDYIALGHIHKSNLSDENQRILYPGSTIALGFDELGKHGMLVGDITKEKIQIEFIPLDEKEFIEQCLEIDNYQTIEELVEAIQHLVLEEHKLYKLKLVGNRNFEIPIYKLEKMIEQRNILKIKDETKIGYPIEELANDITLKGIFIKEMQKKLKEETQDTEMIEKAIEIGIEILS